MRAKPVKPAILLLFAMIGSGCASQNAMTSLPEDVRLSLLADQARIAMNGETGSNPDAEAASPATPAGQQQSQAPKLSQEELLFRARQRQSVETETASGAQTTQSPSPDTAQPDPRKLFAEAMKLRQSTGTGTPQAIPAGEPPSGQKMDQAMDQTADAPASPPSAADVWKRALALNGTKEPAADPQATAPAGDPVEVAAVTPSADKVTHVTAVPPVEDLFVFAISPELARQSEGREIVDHETYVQLALRRKGSRLPRHITIGRIEGKGYEVLKAANEQASNITRIIGGEPTVGYDPELAAGMVRIEYLPGRPENSGGQNS